MSRAGHTQINTLLKTAPVNAQTKVFKRVFISPAQGKIELKKISTPSENKKYATAPIHAGQKSKFNKDPENLVTTVLSDTDEKNTSHQHGLCKSGGAVPL